MPNTHIFTSCTNNYLPLARVLAQSVKKFHPDFCFHLVLNDRLQEWFNLEEEDFDYVITVEDLKIPDLTRWLFKHSVVELCTAVKGLAGKYIIDNYDCDQIFFFDPDVAIFSPLDELIDNFQHSDILITPHQLQPETIPEAVVDNEIAFLRHGTYNLGFIGIKNSVEGIRFLDWWANRCLDYCYADTPYGLYTDQRWGDLVPSFFNGVNILKHPGYNVANWNLSNRDVQGDLQTQIVVNGKPLGFYHFSGSQTIMPKKYDLHNAATLALENWYATKCLEMGQKELSKLSCVYNFFENGNEIPAELRTLYRQVNQLQEDYPNPFSNEFDQWYQSHQLYLETQSMDYLKNQLAKTKDDLILTQQELGQTNQQLMETKALVQAMETSKFWRLRQKWFGIKGKFASVKNLLTRSIFWLPQKIRHQAKAIKANSHKLLITPQYSPKTVNIPPSYYRQNRKILTNPPKISIVTPSYNQAHFIEETIKSVLDQNYPNLEYIVQDGSSTDNTSEVVKKYQDHLQFNSESDQGQANAINKGFIKTTGEIMAWLNSDDLFTPGTLSYVAEYFHKNPQVDVIYGHRIIINEDNLETGRWVLPNHDDKMLQWADYVPQETMFWRRELWEKVGGNIDESFQFAIDWDLILRFRQAGANFRRVPRFLGCFRVHSEQKTQSWNAIGEEEMNILRRQCHGYIPTPQDVYENIKGYVALSLYHYQMHSLKQIFRQGN